MNQIINGKRYDTNTATKIGLYDNRLATSDCKWYRETLMVKRTGEYFLVGQGGPMSIYAERVDNTTSGGVKIIPLSVENAKKWAEGHLTAVEYEEKFPTASEDNDTRYRIGANIRVARECAGLTQTELAELLGTGQSVVARYERGGMDPNAMRIYQIADALGIHAQDLVTDTGNETIFIGRGVVLSTNGRSLFLTYDYFATDNESPKYWNTATTDTPENRERLIAAARKYIEEMKRGYCQSR